MVDIVAPVSDYISGSFFLDNKLTGVMGSNTNVLLSWLELMDIDLGTLAVGDLIFLMSHYQGVKTTTGQANQRISKKSGTATISFNDAVGLIQIWQCNYALTGQSVAGDIIVMLECTVAGTCVMQTEAWNSVGSCLYQTPYNCMWATFLKKA
jgi:hypothetical protein